MKAELIPQEVFDLNVDGYVIKGMRLVSKWNGLLELRNDAGEVVVVSAPERSTVAGDFSTIFGDIFRTAEETKAAGTVIVMGTARLLDSIKRLAKG